MTDILSRHGSDHRETTWAVLDPIAAPVLRATADALTERDVRLTWYDPDGGARLKYHGHAGRLQANDHHTTAAIGNAGHKAGDSAIRRHDAAALGNSGRTTVSQYIALAHGSVGAIARLRLAADLLEAGHDVQIYASDTEFHIELDSKACPCSTCAPAAIVIAA